LKFYEQHDGDVTVVEVAGRIDSNTAKEFGDKLTGLIRSGRTRLVVDFKNIVYISSAGFRALLVTAKLADETSGRFALCGLTAEVRRLFDLGAFTDLFPIFSSREEGLANLQ